MWAAMSCSSGPAPEMRQRFARTKTSDRKWVHALLIALYAYDPEIVILGGSESAAFSFFQKTMMETLVSNFAYQHALQRLAIGPSELPDIALLVRRRAAPGFARERQFMSLSYGNPRTAECLERLLRAQRKAVEEIARRINEEDIRYVFVAARGTSENAARYANYLWGAMNGLPVALAAPSLFTYYDDRRKLKGALVVGIRNPAGSPDIVSVLAEGNAAAIADSCEMRSPTPSILRWRRPLTSSLISMQGRRMAVAGNQDLQRRTDGHRHDRNCVAARAIAVAGTGACPALVDPAGPRP